MGVDIFQQKHLVLSNVNLHVDKGDFVWLIGQTGSGKSSLLKVIYGDLAVSTGDGFAVEWIVLSSPGKELCGGAPLLARLPVGALE